VPVDFKDFRGTADIFTGEAQDTENVSPLHFVERTDIRDISRPQAFIYCRNTLRPPLHVGDQKLQPERLCQKRIRAIMKGVIPYIHVSKPAHYDYR